MKRIAIVVQRCHETIVGGSEALAWQYATLLSEEFQVDVITTTALEYTTWANELPTGCETRQGINIHRFPVTIGRSNYWHNLHVRLLQQYNSSTYSHVDDSQQIPWSIALQEEFIRHQGPYSQPMLSFLKGHWQNYLCIIFATYLYPTSYFGIAQVPSSKIALVPTLHNEPPAYLSAYKYMYKKVRSYIWLTNAEKVLGENLWGKSSGRVIAMGVETTPRNPITYEYPYLLYCGRIDPSKGCNELIDFFIQFKKDNPSNLRLILTGKDAMSIPSAPDIEFKGFVSSEEKFQLMAGASIFVMPSPYESFSIVTLEAMAQGTPVLVNGSCEVLVEHVVGSGGGKIYKSYDEFSSAIKELLIGDNLVEISNLSKQYVVDNYAFNIVRQSLFEEIEIYS